MVAKRLWIYQGLTIILTMITPIINRSKTQPISWKIRILSSQIRVEEAVQTMASSMVNIDDLTYNWFALNFTDQFTN